MTSPGVKLLRGTIMKKLITAILFTFITISAFALPNLLKKEEFGANAIDNLEVSLSWEDIRIKETYDTSSIEVEIYCNYKKYAPEASVSGSSLYIESTKSSFNFFSSPAGLSCTVVVYVPQKKDFDDISIKTSSGDIEIQRPLSARNEISLTASSGDIDSNSGLFADTVKITASSGDVEIFNVDTDDFKTHTSSGDITVKKVTGGTGSIEASSGTIKVDDFSTEYAEFKSSSGSISVKKLDCDYFDARNTSGGITLELTNAPAASSSAECSSGDIDIYLPMRAKFTVDASCSSGTFRDKFTNNRLNPREGYHMDYNGGGPSIKLRTSSGDITLEY